MALNDGRLLASGYNSSCFPGFTSFVRRSLATVLALVGLTGAAEVGAATKLDLPGSTVGFYVVRINGEVVGGPTLFVHEANGSVFVSLETVRGWNVPASGCDATYKSVTFCALETLKVSRIVPSADAHEYDIELAPDALPKTRVDLPRLRQPALQPEPERAAFLNYDLNALFGGSPADGSPRTLSGLFEGGMTTRGGILTTSAVAQAFEPSRAKIALLSTSWQKDNVARHSSLIFGDSITNGGSFGAEFRFTGIGWSSNFDTDPRFITSPTVSLTGVATVPSVLDLYVNNALRYSKDVPTGPFELSGLPAVNGEGQVQVVVRDLLGRQQVITGSYYGTPSVVKRGLDDFAYEAGFERTNYGYRTLQYGPAFIEGNERRGITDRFTAEAHAEAEASLQQGALIGNWLVPKLGIFDAGIAASRGTVGHGAAALFGYDYRGEHLNFGASIQTSSAGFQQIGSGGADLSSSRQTSVRFGLHNDRDSLGIGYAEQTQFGGYSARVLTLSLSRDLGHGELQLDALRTARSGGGIGLDLSYHAALGRRRSLDFEADHQPSYRDDRIELRQSRPAGGFGDASSLQIVSADNNNTISAQRSHWGAAGSSVLTVSSASNALRIASEVTGGVAFVDHERYFTPRLRDAFGVVHVGYSHVRVYEDDQLVGVTNGRGDLLVPNLLAYDSAEIRIEKNDLPLGVVAADDDQTIVPTYREAASVTFETKHELGTLRQTTTLHAKPFTPLVVQLKPIQALEGAPRSSSMTVSRQPLNPCAVQPMTDAARNACIPMHVREVLNQRNRLYAQCESADRHVTPQMSKAFQKYCEDWSDHHTSVVFAQTVKSR